MPDTGVNSSVVGTAIGSVQMKADGIIVGNATYGVSRSDVCNVYPGRAGCPNVGYTYQWDTTILTPGSHTLTAAATDTDAIPDTGSLTTTVIIAPVPPTVTPPTVRLDIPSDGATVSGIVTVAGWALDNSAVVGTAISNMQIKVDGVVVGNATYGGSRLDVCAVYPGRGGARMLASRINGTRPSCRQAFIRSRRWRPTAMPHQTRAPRVSP